MTQEWYAAVERIRRTNMVGLDESTVAPGAAEEYAAEPQAEYAPPDQPATPAPAAAPAWAMAPPQPDVAQPPAGDAASAQPAAAASIGAPAWAMTPPEPDEVSAVVPVGAVAGRPATQAPSRHVENGRRVAPSSKRRVRYTIDLSPEQHRFLKRFAVDSDVDASAVTRTLLAILEDDERLASRVRESLLRQ